MVSYSCNHNDNKGGEEKLMGQIQLIGSLVMIGLFTIALIGFGINFAADNDSPIDIADDSEISSLYDNTKSDVGEFEGDSSDQYQSILETTTGEQGTAPSTGPFAVTPLNAIGVVKNIMQTGYTKIFGTGDGFGIFLTSFIAIIVFIAGLYIYKTLRGLPD